MLRSDEIFCIDAVVASFGGKWSEGEDPPDAYLSIGTEKIAVEITTLTQYVTDHHGGSKPRLSEDFTAIRLCNELDEELKDRVPARRTILLILSAPIKSARKLKPQLSEEILALVESAGEADVSVQREILGNKITIHNFPEDRPSGKKIVGVVENKKSSADILANAKSILMDRIVVKGQKCYPLIPSNPAWLALFNDYWLADIDTYRQAMAQISHEHPFEKILIVSGDGSVTVLYEKHKKNKYWIYSILIGGVLALAALYHLHKFMLVDACLDFGGQYIYNTGICIDGEGHEHIIVFSGYMLVFYAVVGLLVAGVSAFIANKILIIFGGKSAAT